MATRTISNAGGNYNATGTWVEGIVPTSADDVVATATSGQLTVNVASAAATFNFTNYTNTLTVNAVWTVSGTGTQTFVSAMTIAGTSNITLTGAGAAITSNGKTIPNLNLSSNKTLNDTLNIINFTSANSSIFTGNAINCSGNWTSGTVNIGGTTIINLIGTGIISLGNYIGSGGINLNTSGTLSGNTIGIGLSSNTVLNYSGGTLSQMRLKISGQPITINGNGVEFESFDDTGVSSTQSTINIPTEFKVKYFNGAIGTSSFNPATHNQITFAGAGALNVTQSMNLTNLLVNSVGVLQYKPYNIAFQTGVTHTIASLSINGFQAITSNTTLSAAFCNFRSSSAGNRANINLTSPSTSIISNTNITDINFTGPRVYTLGGGAITNSVNVSNIPLVSGGGGAWTFVN